MKKPAKYSVIYHTCKKCKRRIAKTNVAPGDKCPICGGPIFSRQVWKHRRRVVRQGSSVYEWTLGYGHPDYKIDLAMKARPPMVNMICRKCHRIFADQYMPADIKLYQKTLKPKDRLILAVSEEYLKFVVWMRQSCCEPRPYDRVEFYEFYNSGHPETGVPHSMARLHRLFSFTPFYQGKFGEGCDLRFEDEDSEVQCYIRFPRLDKWTMTPEEEHRKAVPAVPPVELLFSRVRCTEGGQAIIFGEDNETSSYETEAACFIGMHGFTVNPVETFDNETLDDVWDGLVKKNERTMTALRRQGHRSG